eukprot:scaffold1052_cov198-Alexandrium_tamarense.AAC.13
MKCIRTAYPFEQTRQSNTSIMRQGSSTTEPTTSRRQYELLCSATLLPTRALVLYYESAHPRRTPSPRRTTAST